ncbi:Vegetative incompatibility protein HET-E-1 [Ceratocystis platani]|uniref:Vegetative incompatibility protein HET-E-1 n=1 Tax=Ceratocystis fimbriata f. sp. platani TaxID=88771 RepID=A0A0F8BW78_CERFI|nr:Vegetative incompatibility protein HET-E-1 [Ceratocystis platani]
MLQFVQDGIKKTAKEAAVKQRANDGLQTVQAIREIMEGAVRVAPEPAVVWAAVSLGIEILSNPITEALQNRIGMEYVLCRMEWYWNLADLLLDKNKCETATAAMQEKLEKDIVQLFQKLLLYQMRSVRLYHRSRAAVITRDMFRIDDWTSQLNSIKEAEETVQRHIDQYNTQENRIRLQNLKDTAISLQQSLQSIDQTMQNQLEQQAQRHEDDHDKQCLSDFYLTDPRIDKKEIEDKKGGLLKDSYKWILSHPNFQQFLGQEESRILWIRGDPGKGKTMLLCGLIDELEPCHIRATGLNISSCML